MPRCVFQAAGQLLAARVAPFVFAMAGLLLASCSGAPGTIADGRLDSLARSFDQKFGIDLQFRDRMETAPDLEYSMPSQSDDGDVLACASDLYNQLAEYDRRYLRLMRLKRIVICGYLRTNGAATPALPDPEQGTLYFDYAACAGDPTDEAHVFHHELLHYLIGATKGSLLWTPRGWEGLNPRGFHYGSGPYAHRNGSEAILNHPDPGFVDKYAECDPQEDMAEMAACLRVPEERSLIVGWRRIDPYLDRKYKLLEKFLANPAGTR